MTSKFGSPFLWISLVLSPAVIKAQDGGNSANPIPEVLPRNEEVRLALSASPVTLRDGAGVYALEENGFVLIRESTNGFTCIVNRDSPWNLKPVCYDAAGSEAILPVTVLFGRRLMQRVPVNEIRREIEEGFESGVYSAPSRPGVAYMLSNEIRNCRAADSCGTFPPHIMFYAPNMTNTDIGTSRELMQESSMFPFIAYQGPHGFMVVRIQ
ncbi:MAG: hypothetical protein O7D29_00795 [Gemmatimonadetes bacterium]|nr:hypothetical protein [Gemmatimonadota bacterium]